MNCCVHIIDDHEDVRESLALLLMAERIPSVGYASAEEFLETSTWTVPGCLVLDLHLEGMGGVELLNELSGVAEPPSTVVLTGHGSIEAAVETVKHGAIEFLQKPCPNEILLTAIRRAIELDHARLERIRRRDELESRLASLTQRERSVLDEVMRGGSSAAIASSLGLQPKSVEIYRSHILHKLGFDSTIDLVRGLLLAAPDRWAS